jgi:hypothetical protein
MRIELTIKVTYLPNWGAYEGLRELLQNARDAETEHNAPMTVTYKAGQVVITNEGCVLNHRDLLLGQTSKDGRADLIGKFGEGLKLGVLALVRDGHAVRITTGGESWIPVIEESETFGGEQVLVFKTRALQSTNNRVSIEIDGITRQEWETMKQSFLFLLEKGTEVETCNGTILLEDGHKGKVFVRGIFVQYLADITYGYDLFEADLDRDRRMVENWDLRYRIRNIWQEAVSRRSDLFGRFTQLLETSAQDLAGIDDFAAGYMDREVRNQVTKSFLERHGADAVPVMNLAESAEIGHLGKQGVIVNKPLGAILTSIMGTTASIKEKLRQESTVIYGWHALTGDEQKNLTSSIAILNEVEVPICLADIDVTDFRDNSIGGMYKDDRIIIAKKYLAIRKETMKVLVHEYAHKSTKAPDGAKQHVTEIERIWADVTDLLLNAN